tara:strand:- start:116 stop:517 length:402 start_codon:yes stop_codon:yes gene_type:complete
MSKIYGDEFKYEIRKLKRLDKKILECKAHAERIRYECETNPALDNDSVTLIEAIRSLLNLSKKVVILQDTLEEYDKTYESIDNWVIKKLMKNKVDKDDFKRIYNLRTGAERLTNMYSDTLKKFGKKLRDKRSE